MEIKEILQKLDEDQELTIEVAKQVLDDENVGYYDEDIKEMEISTMYDTYKGFGDGYTMVIKADVFQEFIKDTCREFTQCLPDKFDEYFDLDAMIKDVIDNDWKVVLGQAQEFMKKQGRDIDEIKDYKSSFEDCYLVELG